jgi:RNA polymerase sigma-70 factor (ECF subfamily)
MTEEKAIHLCLKEHDPAGFEFLVKQFRREAYYHAYALLGNEADAADVCQDSFANAFAAMPRLKALDRFYPWFYRILRNRCFNLLDRRRTRERYTRKSIVVKETEASPGQLLEEREQRERVWLSLAKLKPNHREILTLKYIHDFSYAEISETLGIPRGTVMSRLYVARSAFRVLYHHRLLNNYER